MVLIFVSNELLLRSNINISNKLTSLTELVPVLLSHEGSKSLVGFPSEPSGEAGMQGNLETPQFSDGGGGAGATVLIVDDEEAARQLCSDVALEAGLRVRTASTTEKALEDLEEHPVDIVISDLRVPEQGGIELLRRIREQHPQVVVVMLTQYGTVPTAVESLHLGASD